MRNSAFTVECSRPAPGFSVVVRAKKGEPETAAAVKSVHHGQAFAAGTDRLYRVGAHRHLDDDEFHRPAAGGQSVGGVRVRNVWTAHPRVSGGIVELVYDAGECLLSAANATNEGVFP